MAMAAIQAVTVPVVAQQQELKAGRKKGKRK